MNADSPIARMFRLIAPLVLFVGVARAQPGFGGSMGDPFGDDEPAVTVSVAADRDEVTPGGELVLAVTLDHADGYHTNLHDPVVPPEMEGFIPVATEIRVGDGPFKVGPIQWPEPHEVSVNFTGAPIPYRVYSGKAVAFVPVRIAGHAPAGPMTIELEVVYQSCDDVSCLPPETVPLSVTVQVVDASAEAGPVRTLSGFDASVFDSPWDDGGDKTSAAKTVDNAGSDTSTGSVGGGGGTFFGITIPSGGGAAGMVVLGLLGAAGGLILNLTPCVLPVIPIKVMTLSQHAGENRVRAAMLGLWMALGVIAFWAALSVPVLFIRGFTDPSRIFGIWWLTTGIGAVIAVMSLGLLGLFQITLPQKVYMVNPKADTAWGSFVFGVMTAVLGLPCFGFVAGALVPAAITQGTGFVVVLFASMGVGMALPYLVLSIFPGLVDRLPRTGPASELVKQIMALLLLAAAAYFIGSGTIALVSSKPYLAKLLHIWVAALFGVGAGLWLAVRTFQITRRPAPRVVFTLLALIIAGLGIIVADWFTSDAREDYELRAAAMREASDSGALLTSVWLDYTPQLKERALAQGKVVVQDFTAEWCINCKVIEKTVLGIEPVKSVLKSDDTVLLKVDLTGKNPEGEAALAALGRTGIPTLAIYGPGLEKPWVASAYTPEQVVEAIRRAGGGGG